MNGNVMHAYNNQHLLDAYISAKRIEGCSEKTLAYYGLTIKQMYATVNKSVPDITTDDVRVFLGQHQKRTNCTNVTLNNMRRNLSSFFGWLENEEHIIKSPMRRIKNIKTDKLIKEVYSDEQLEAVRKACANLRDAAIVNLLYSTGIRISELVLLNRKNVDLENRECKVFGKGGKERIAYFDGRTKLSVEAYLATRTDDNEALFVSLNNPTSRLGHGGIETRLREIGHNLGFRVHPHKFRRTIATHAIDKGMPIEQVQQMLGHVRIDTTMHYAMVNQANVKNSHRKYIG